MDELEIAARKLCEIRGVDPDKLRMNHNMNWVMGDGEQAEWKFLIPEIEQEKQRHEVREALGYEKTN